MTAPATLSGRRRLGIAAHITSLPGGGAQGTLGDGAYRFVDFLAAAGCSVWQVLPLNPVNTSGSPYQSSSVFAGNTALAPDPASVVPEGDYQQFLRAQSWWLEDYALYAAIHNDQGGRPWYLWPAELRGRDHSALEQAHADLAHGIETICKDQYRFFRAWQKLRRYANNAGVYIFGDLPMFVAHDSADVWCRQEFFRLDENGCMTCTAGAPPDGYTAAGQNWGCPEYHWEALAADSYRWWRARLAMQAELFDLVRLDHFRGFVASWSVPAGAPSAVGGAWVPVPGRALFAALQSEMEALQFVAENLGDITPEVERLRTDLHLPGMRVLQFAFGGGADNPHLPANHARDDVVYTGTHDNDTTLGWWQSLDAKTQAQVRTVLGQSAAAMPQSLMEAALASACWLAVLPLQDCLGLGSAARMNTPSRSSGNWAWRCPPGVLDAELETRLCGLSTRYGRGG